MKRIVFLLFITLTFLVSLSVQSQNPDRFPALRERMDQAKLRELKKVLQLDSATFSKFRPVYKNYEREIARVDLQNQTRLLSVDADSLTAEEADRLIVMQLNSAKRIVFIRERFFNQFRKVLTPNQVIKLYQSEGNFRKKVMAEKERRKLRR